MFWFIFNYLLIILWKNYWDFCNFICNFITEFNHPLFLQFYQYFLRAVLSASVAYFLALSRSFWLYFPFIFLIIFLPRYLQISLVTDTFTIIQYLDSMEQSIIFLKFFTLQLRSNVCFILYANWYRTLISKPSFNVWKFLIKIFQKR